MGAQKAKKQGKVGRFIVNSAPKLCTPRRGVQNGGQNSTKCPGASHAHNTHIVEPVPGPKHCSGHTHNPGGICMLAGVPGGTKQPGKRGNTGLGAGRAAVAQCCPCCRAVDAQEAPNATDCTHHANVGPNVAACKLRELLPCCAGGAYVTRTRGSVRAHCHWRLRAHCGTGATCPEAWALAVSVRSCYDLVWLT